MSVFHDMVSSDLDVVFLDLDYFGETHIVDGREINCVFDEITGQGRNADYSLTENVRRLFAKTIDLPDKKPAGNGINVDGEQYLITDWHDEMGMAEIHLSAAEGW